MRQLKFLTALCVVAGAALWMVSTATAGTGHFVDNASTPVGCVVSVSGQTGSIECSGKVAGYGSNDPVRVFIVISTQAGCSTSGNPDIPGQRNFVSSELSPDSGGNIVFGPTTTNEVEGSVSCHGNQLAFISSTGTLSLYNCTSGSPTFRINKKTGLQEQTNTACTLEDTASF